MIWRISGITESKGAGGVVYPENELKPCVHTSIQYFAWWIFSIWMFLEWNPLQYIGKQFKAFHWLLKAILAKLLNLRRKSWKFPFMPGQSEVLEAGNCTRYLNCGCVHNLWDLMLTPGKWHQNWNKLQGTPLCCYSRELFGMQNMHTHPHTQTHTQTHLVSQVLCDSIEERCVLPFIHYQFYMYLDNCFELNLTRET
jgi:hypothetical protein